MNAYEFFKCPSWVFPTAVVVNKTNGCQAVVKHIDWNASVPEVYFVYDGTDKDSRCPMTEFFGRFRPWFDVKGEQSVGMAARSRTLHDAYDFSVRSLNIFDREGWTLMTLGEFVEKFTVEDLVHVRGIGKKVLNEIKECLIENGMTLRNFSKEEE